MKILLTGFAPFGKYDINPSRLAVQGLPEQFSGHELVKLELPVSFDRAFPCLQRAICEQKPGIIILVGLAAERKEIAIERVAINIDDARIADNDGFQPQNRVIDYSAPAAWFSTLPVSAICAALQREAISAVVSNSAGTFVCNHVLFRLLQYLYTSLPGVMGGFIHVPPTMEMRDYGMSVQDMQKALLISIQVSLEAFQSPNFCGSRLMVRPWNPEWPAEFVRIRQELQAGLSDLALFIDHIGSTAVPGLCAKDIIDVQITVRALEDKLLQAMKAMGYQWREHVLRDHVPVGMEADEGNWEKWFFRPPPGRRSANIHVRVAGRSNQWYPLLFRDFLIAHPETAKSYGELKIRLAANLANPASYPDVKDPAVDLIIFPALKWGHESGWFSKK
jgi:pyroglutamyl-peptidase I